MKLLPALFALLMLSASRSDVQQWKLVPAESSAKFSLRNFGLGVEGSFGQLAGTASFTTEGKPTAIRAEAKVASINTGIGARDSHLREKDYFDAEKYPTISFVSEQVAPDGKTCTGRFIIKDVSKNLTLPFLTTAKGEHHILSTHFKIDRRDYHVGGNSLVMGDSITIAITLSFAKP